MKNLSPPAERSSLQLCLYQGRENGSASSLACVAQSAVPLGALRIRAIELGGSRDFRTAAAAHHRNRAAAAPLPGRAAMDRHRHLCHSRNCSSPPRTLGSRRANHPRQVARFPSSRTEPSLLATALRGAPSSSSNVAQQERRNLGAPSVLGLWPEAPRGRWPANTRRQQGAPAFARHSGHLASTALRALARKTTISRARLRELWLKTTTSRARLRERWLDNGLAGAALRALAQNDHLAGAALRALARRLPRKRWRDNGLTFDIGLAGTALRALARRRPRARRSGTALRALARRQPRGHRSASAGPTATSQALLCGIRLASR